MTDAARRRFLTTTALCGLGSLGSFRAAGAFTPQVMDPEAHQAWLDRCSADADPYHLKLLADARAGLVAKGVDAAGITRALGALTCPVCGCPLATPGSL